MSWRDLVRIERDTSADGEEHSWQALIAEYPCTIRATAGVETWRGKQLEPSVSLVITGSANQEFGRITPRDRIIVLEASDVLAVQAEIVAVIEDRKPGRDGYIDIFCKEIPFAS